MTSEQEYQKAYQVKYRIGHLAELKAKKAIYYQNNKDRIKNKTRTNYFLNKEKAKRYNIQYRLKNSDALKAKKKIYWENNKDILKEKSTIYIQKNRLKINKRMKQYYEKNKIKICQNVRLYRIKHIDAVKLTAKKYLKTPKGKAGKTEVSNNRRMQMATNILQRKLIKQWLVEIYSKPTFKCYWCEDIFPIAMFSKDHIIALKLGGKHELENVCASCKSCNIKKKAMTVEEWVAKINLEKEQLRLAI